MSLTLAAVSPAISAAILQQELVDSHLPADFHPHAISQPGADGFWAIGTSNDRTVMARYNANGSVRAMFYPDSAFSGASQVAALADGGALALDSGLSSLPQGYFYLRRFAANGNLQWSTPIGPSVDDGFFVDGSGGIWVFPNGVTSAVVEQIDGNGVIGTPRTLAIDHAQRATADPAQAAIYIAGAANRSPAANDTLGSIWKVDAGGIVWTASVADAGSLIEDVTVAPDGSLWGFGSLGTQLYGMHVSSDGTVLWSGAFATSTHPTQLRIVARPDGSVATLHWDQTAFDNRVPGATAELDAFSAAGVRLWQLQTGFVYSAFPTLLAAPNGDLFAATAATATNGPYLDWHEQTLRVDTNGNPRYPSTTIDWNLRYTYEAHILDDDSILSVFGALDRRDVDGMPLTTAPTQGLVAGSAQADISVHAPDGAAYLLMDSQDAHAIEVLAYGADGSPRWHAQVGSGWTYPFLYMSALQLRQADVCAAGPNGGKEILRCFALTDGTPTVTLDLGQNPVGNYPQATAGLGPSNELILIYAAQDGTHHAVVDSAGNLSHDVVVPNLPALWSAGYASGGMTWATGGSQLWRIALDGSVQGPVTLDVSPTQVTPTPDGGVLLSTPGATPSIEALDSHAQRRWQTPLPMPGLVAALDPAATGSVAYVTMDNLPPNFTFGTLSDFTTLQLSLADGSIGWSSTTPWIIGATPQAVLDKANGQLILVSDWAEARNHAQIVRLALASGNLQGRTFVPCNVDQCSVSDAMLANDGSLRLTHETNDYRTGLSYELTAVSNDADTIFAEGFGD